MADRPFGHPPYDGIGQPGVMSDDRRCRVPGGTYLFTINLLERRSGLLIRHIDILREAVRCTRLARTAHPSRHRPDRGIRWRWQAGEERQGECDAG